MFEIDRLEEMLKEASIPFVCNGEDLRQEYDYFHLQILYPNSYKRVCSVVQGTCTYGGLENKLEIMGLLTEEEK